MPLRHLHICSGESGVLGFGGAPLIDEGRAHAATQPNADAVEINSRRALFALLDRIGGENARLESLDFHTHGGPGAIVLGNYTITGYTWRSDFESYHSLFARNARIEFHGCSVAEEANGEVFLADCGAFLLRSAGGTVTGHVGVTLSTRAWGFDSSTPAYTGPSVRANVRVGGTVILEGARFLLPHVIRRRLENLRLSIARIGRGRTDAAIRDRLDRATQHLDRAESLLGNHPSYRHVWIAFNAVSNARRLVPAPERDGWIRN